MSVAQVTMKAHSSSFGNWLSGSTKRIQMSETAGMAAYRKPPTAHFMPQVLVSPRHSQNITTDAAATRSAKKSRPSYAAPKATPIMIRPETMRTRKSFTGHQSAADAPHNYRARPQRPLHRNRATGYQETTTPHKPLATKGNWTGEPRPTCGSADQDRASHASVVPLQSPPRRLRWQEALQPPRAHQGGARPRRSLRVSRSSAPQPKSAGCCPLSARPPSQGARPSQVRTPNNRRSA